MPASVPEQASLSLTWSETPEDKFSHDEAHLFSGYYFADLDREIILLGWKFYTIGKKNHFF